MKAMLVAIMVAMVVGVAVYLRLWTIDYYVSSTDTDLLRKQFDLANREAMDESAEWRWKYDKEFDRANKCEEELRQEKSALLEQVEALKRELELEKSKCRSMGINR